MTIRELKELVNGVGEEHLDEEVYLLIQPNWPFVYSVSSAEYISKLEFEYPATGDPDDDEEGFMGEARPGLYLAESSQLGYASNVELDHFGWRDAQ